MLVRRDILRGGSSTALLALVPGASAVPLASTPFGGVTFAEAVRAAEAQGGGRLGVAVLDSDTGQRFSWRGGERFPVTSTFKFLAAGPRSRAPGPPSTDHRIGLGRVRADHRQARRYR